MNGDGRLDLDELGSVIESARSIDEPVDVVGEEPARTWGERLESSGVTPWLRRHRVAVASGAAAVLVIGVGATTWVRAQPPPWHQASVEVVPATMSSEWGTSMRTLDDGTAMAAYLTTTDDTGTRVTIDGVEGPGIRASSVGAPLATGNPRASLVRAVIGCDDDALTAAPGDYRMRLTTTDAWGRATTTFAGIPSDGTGWPEAVLQRCWQQAVFSRVRVTDVRADVDEGAGAVLLRVGVLSTLPGEVEASLDALTGETAIVPTGIGTPLPAGEVATVTGRLDVWDCSAGTPAVPTATVPDSPTNQMRWHEVDGVGMQVYANGRQAWGLTAASFTPAQKAEVRRALASVCAGAPDVRVDDARVVRLVRDDAASAVSLTLVVDAALPAGRLAKIGVTQDQSMAYPDPSLSAWSVLPPGGGRGEAVWTFSCYGVPTPPALDVRFVDGIRPTPVRVPLDQEALAPWVTEACPQLTPELLVEQGWQLP